MRVVVFELRFGCICLLGVMSESGVLLRGRALLIDGVGVAVCALNACWDFVGLQVAPSLPWRGVPFFEMAEWRSLRSLPHLRVLVSIVKIAAPMQQALGGFLVFVIPGLVL